MCIRDSRFTCGILNISNGGHHKIFLRIILSFQIAAQHGIRMSNPVSYTHLDVYKRQESCHIKKPTDGYCLYPILHPDDCHCPIPDIQMCIRDRSINPPAAPAYSKYSFCRWLRIFG